jgi:hypothetical protein
MLDGKRYDAQFPKEESANTKPMVHNPSLIAALRALAPFYSKSESSRLTAAANNGGSLPNAALALAVVLLASVVTAVWNSG